MSTDQDLAGRIDEEMQAVGGRIEEIQAAASEELGDLEGRCRQYEAFVSRLREAGSRPLQTLASKFEHAAHEVSEVNSSVVGTVTFKHTPQYPATVKVTMRLGHDADIRNVSISIDYEILPLFLSCERHHSMTAALEEADVDAFVSWANDRVVDFVRTYNSLQYVDQYQQGNLVSDPVVNVRFSKLHAAATEEYKGVTYHFVAPESHALFVEDPTRFVGE